MSSKQFRPIDMWDADFVPHIPQVKESIFYVKLQNAKMPIQKRVKTDTRKSATSIKINTKIINLT